MTAALDAKAFYIGISASARHATEIRRPAPPRLCAREAAIPMLRVPKPSDHPPSSNIHPPKRSPAQAGHLQDRPPLGLEEGEVACRRRRPNLHAPRLRMRAREEVLQAQTLFCRVSYTLRMSLCAPEYPIAYRAEQSPKHKSQRSRSPNHRSCVSIHRRPAVDDSRHPLPGKLTNQLA